MLKTEAFFKILCHAGVRFYTGIPDSLLKPICSYLDDNVSNNKHIIAANEGSAIALAMGHYLGSKTLPLVYMQNSGIGNAINPLISLTDKEVYSIPLILLIGWRGEPKTKDEPQHIKQGKITIGMLKIMKIPHLIISKDKNISTIKKEVSRITNLAMKKKCPVAIVVRKNTFSEYKLSKRKNYPKNLLSRADVIEYLTSKINSNSIVVSTTGVTSRELLESRIKNKQSSENDFLTVGGMGHANQIALGLAIQQKNRKVICIDGDGSLLMHMGSLASIVDINCSNYLYILINNGVHDSVGGQKIGACNINFCAVAKGCGFKKVISIKNKVEIKKINNIQNLKGPTFIEIITKPGYRLNLIRPKNSPKKNKELLLKSLLGN